jgi:hypothetical protein
MTMATAGGPAAGRKFKFEFFRRAGAAGGSAGASVSAAAHALRTSLQQSLIEAAKRGTLFLMDGYELLEPLPGGCGRARVFRARQRGTGALLALKRAPARRSGAPAFNAECAAAQLAELQRLRSLRHSNLAALEHAFLDADGGALCTVAPLATGGSLEDAQLAAGGTLAGESLTWAANGVVQALCYLHARDPAPLLHRVRGAFRGQSS